MQIASDSINDHALISNLLKYVIYIIYINILWVTLEEISLKYGFKNY